MDLNELRSLVELLEKAGWTQAHLTGPDYSISISKHGPVGMPAPAGPAAVPVPAPAPVSAPTTAPTTAPAAAPTGSARGNAGAAGTAVADGTTAVTASTVGTFYRAPSPGAAPFAEVGQPVAAGDTIGLVEVMKLMTAVEASVSGTLVAFEVDNAEMVEHGQVIARIRADA